MSQSQRPRFSGTFLVTGAHGLTRIAYTQDFNKRISEWQAASPHALSVIGTVTVPSTVSAVSQWLRAHTPTLGQSVRDLTDPKAIYQALKRTFADCRIRGDWFALDGQSINSLPLERHEFEKAHETAPPLTVLSICGHARTFPSTPQTWELPDAPVVGAAVAYAKSQVSKRSHSRDGAWLYDMEKQVVRWLIRHGSDDISIPFKFQQQYDELRAVVSQRFDFDADDIWDTCSWLLLQGRGSFSSFLAEPHHLDELYDIANTLGTRDYPLYEAMFACEAFNKTTRQGLRAGDPYLDWFDALIHVGDKADSVAGWSAKRLAAEIDKGTFPIIREAK